MSGSKLEMSLDDIIKANKKKVQSGGRLGQGRPRRDHANAGPSRKVGGRITKRKTLPKKGRVTNNGKAQGRKPANVKNQNKNFNRRIGQGQKKTNVSAVSLNKTTKATRILVQKLVKKALAQRNVQSKQVNRRLVGRAVSSRGGVSLVKKTTVLNRISPQSRVITRRPRVTPPATRIVKKIVHVNRPSNNQRFRTAARETIIEYVNAPQRNFTPRRRNAPAYQQMTVREQINALRRQSQPQQRHRVVYVQQQQRQNPQVRRQLVVKKKSNNGRFQHQRYQRQRPLNTDPFYEPPNFLQRI